MTANLIVHRRRTRPSPTARDVLAVLFRQKRILVATFATVLIVVFCWTALHPRYEGEMEFLVQKDRVNPIVGPADLQVPLLRTDVSEEELNSEAEILRSSDLLQSVARESKLLQATTTGSPDLEAAVRGMKHQLRVETVRRTNLIRIVYRGRERAETEKVLAELARRYLARHTELHRPAGSFTFFQQQAQHYAEGLQSAESNLLRFTRDAGIVDASTQRDLALQKLNEFEAMERQTQIALQEGTQRIRTLENATQTTADRETTVVKVADNPFLLQQLKTTLNTLQLKRTELLTKFQPSYRLVQEVDKQIEDTRVAIAAEESHPVREEVTDKEPNHAWAKSELLRARVELQTLRARSAANQTVIAQYRAVAQRMGEASVHQDDLRRMARIAEENYVLYRRKREETRISDALDERGILNVTLAEAPIVPSSPVWPIWMCGLIALAFASGSSVITAFACDRLNPTFRTPAEVIDELGTPVLASLPRGSWPTGDDL